MAKRLILVIALLLVCSPGFAASRNPANVSEGETNYTNIGAVGLDTGAPGYLKLTNGSGTEFYFWIGTDGKLRYASAIALSYTNWGLGNIRYEGTLYPTSSFLGATPPTIKWEDASGIIIGTQAAQ